MLTDEGMVRREVSDLDKSIKEMVEEGKTINSYNDREPLPPTIAFVRKRDKTVIKARKIFWDAYNIIAWFCLLLFGGVLLFASFNAEVVSSHFSREFILAFYVVGLFIIAASVIALFRKDKIVVKRDKIVIVHKFMLFSRKNNEIKKQTSKRSKLPSTRQPAGITFRLFPTTEPLSSAKRFQLRICAGSKSF